METPHLSIRPILPEDYPKLLEVYNIEENMRDILSGKFNWTLAELKHKWSKVKYNPENQFGFQVVTLKSTGELIGECGLIRTSDAPDKSLELAYLIDRNHWKKGYGTEICKALIQFGFETLSTEKLKAGMYSQNEGSIKIVEKLGLQLSLEGIAPNGRAFKEYEINKGDYYAGKPT